MIYRVDGTTWFVDARFTHGHWHPIADIPVEHAQLIGPHTVHASYVYMQRTGVITGRDVYHELPGVTYRIYERVGGDISYFQWWDINWTRAQQQL